MISLTANQMRRVDELAVTKYGIRLEQMMELAGISLASLARKALADSLENKKVVVLTGKGNNGGGGLVAARHLSNWGADVFPIISQRTGLKASVEARLKTLEALGTEILFFDPELEIAHILIGSDLIVDALIGYSIEGNPRYPVSEMIERANDSQRPIMSLDLPSGLHATTGEVYEPCIKAEYTLTLALPKKGLLVREARRYVGNLFLADIGIPPVLYRDIGIEVGNIFKDETAVRIY